MSPKVFVLLVLITASNLCFVFSVFQYPNVRRDDSVSNNYFGTNVKDPYRWLENPDSDETKKFVSDQNDVTKRFVDNNQFRQNISQNFRDLSDYPKYGVPIKSGTKYYYWANSGLQNQNVFYSVDSNSKEKVFLDPNQLNSDGTTSLLITSFSEDGKYCAHGISEGGSDWSVIKIKDADTLQDLPETLTKIKFSSIAWTPDNLGFFYAQYDQYNGNARGTDSQTPKHQKLFYHRINSNQSEDLEKLGFPNHPYLSIGDITVSDCGKYVHIFPWIETSSSLWLFAEIDSLPIKNALNFRLVTKTSAIYQYVTSDNNLVYMLTNNNAPNFRLVKIDLNKPDESNWVNILPETKLDFGTLKNVVAINKDFLIVVYMRNVIEVIHIHNLVDGNHLWTLDTPIGTVGAISAERNDTYFFYKMTSFLNPIITYRYDFSTNTTKVIMESKVPGLDPQQFDTHQVFFPSKDGTVTVPMFIVHRKNIKLDGTNPTLLYAYGGFNAISSPGYSVLGTFFIKHLNGVYAVANIRGGGEYGGVWHKSGMKTKKQNVFDDFASAAEYLIKNKYTQRDRLTIHGISNGGLLIGVSANQRPDLFGCALAQVGVMDMLRFPLFTTGYAWRDDFGDPQNNKTEFEYIYRYSPLHSIPDKATQYPAMLVLTGDHDDRVVPAHSHKFAAQLQHSLGAKLPDTPLMIRIDTKSGHGAGKSLTKSVEENTDIVSFVLNSLKINYNGN